MPRRGRGCRSIRRGRLPLTAKHYPTKQEQSFVIDFKNAETFNKGAQNYPYSCQLLFEQDTPPQQCADCIVDVNVTRLDFLHELTLVEKMKCPVFRNEAQIRHEYKTSVEKLQDSDLADKPSERDAFTPTMRQMTPLQCTVMDEWRDDPNSACGLRYGEAQGRASGQRGGVV